MGTRLALAVALTVMLTGCSGGAEQEAEAPAAPAKTTLTPGQASEPVVADLAGSCAAYFGEMEDDALAQRVLRAVASTSMGSDDLAEYDGLATELRTLSGVADPSLRRPLVDQAELLEAYSEDIQQGEAEAHDTEPFMASKRELADLCRVHLSMIGTG